MFEPIQEKARWVMVYDHIKDKQVGDFITYAEIATVLSLNTDSYKEMQILQNSVGRARKEFLREKLRALETVKGFGYSVVETTEQMRLSANHQKKSMRSLKKSRDHVAYVDRNRLDDDTARRFENAERAVDSVIRFNRQMDIRKERTQTALSSVITKSTMSEEQKEVLRKRLAEA